MSHPAVLAARVKRRELYESMVRLEAILTSPAAAPLWIEDVHQRATAVREALSAHILEVERDHGIIARILDDQPRLESHGKELVADHPRLAERVDYVLELTTEGAEPPPSETITEVRHAVLELLGVLTRHRQAGADLVFDAYDVDIGGQA
jgi:hypothetical protein